MSPDQPSNEGQAKKQPCDCEEAEKSHAPIIVFDVHAVGEVFGIVRPRVPEYGTPIPEGDQASGQRHQGHDSSSAVLEMKTIVATK